MTLIIKDHPENRRPGKVALVGGDCKMAGSTLEPKEVLVGATFAPGRYNAEIIEGERVQSALVRLDEPLPYSKRAGKFIEVKFEVEAWN